MHDKVVLITGASSGIGAGTAILLASRGCLLSLTGRNPSNLQDTYRKCLEAGSKPNQVFTIVADLEKEGDTKLIVDETVKKFGRIDVLVNNAGLIFRGSVQDFKIEEFDRTMNVNLRAAFIMMQLCIPYLIQTKGNIVNVSSYFSTTPAHPFAAYCISKAAMDHLTRMAAKELSPKQVRVNAVNPGYVPTNLQARTGIPISEEGIKKWHALGRGGTVDEVAKAINFLADQEQSSFVTGELLYVDGGGSLVGYDC